MSKVDARIRATRASRGASTARSIRTAARGSPASHRAASASARAQQAGDPAPRRLDLVRREVRAEGLAEVGVESGGDDLEPGELLVGHRLPGPAPQDGAELGVGVEADAVVDAVAVPAGHRQHVAALAVGVVDHGVEDHHPPERAGVLVDEGDVVVAVVDAVEDVQPPRPLGQRPHDGHGLLVVGGLLPDLHHPGAVGPVTQERQRHDVPAEGLGHQVGGPLAVGEGAVGEVPQRPLPRDRLVDHGRAAHVADEGRVGRRHHPAVQRQLAAEELRARLPHERSVGAHVRPAPGLRPRAGDGRWPGRTGDPPGRSGPRRTGSWGGRPRPRARRAGRRRAPRRG